jgi:hypothetical protein
MRAQLGASLTIGLMPVGSKVPYREPQGRDSRREVQVALPRPGLSRGPPSGRSQAKTKLAGGWFQAAPCGALGGPRDTSYALERSGCALRPPRHGRHDEVGEPQGRDSLPGG